MLIKIFLYYLNVINNIFKTFPEPPIPSLQLQSTWLDVFPSEKVEFKCSINGNSDWTFIWYKNEEKLQDSDPNVSFSPDGSVLTITAAQTYSGNYSCNGQHKSKDIRAANSSSLTLTVNGKFHVFTHIFADCLDSS